MQVRRLNQPSLQSHSKVEPYWVWFGTWVERRLERALAQPIDENESKKDALSEATPIQLHLKELYGECYPHTLASNPEIKVVSYAGKTFGRC